MKRLVVGILGGLVMGYALSGLYTVGPSQRGVETILGRVVLPPAGPGLHYHLPYPLGGVHVVDVSKVRVLKLNFVWPHLRHRRALLLTGDENAVNVSLQLHWVVSDPVRFLFAASMPSSLIARHAEATTIDVLSRLKVDDALTVARPLIANRVRLSVNRFASMVGIKVTAVLVESIDPPLQVRSAFAAVASARADAQRRIDEARGDRNRRLPKARSDAQRKVLIARAKARELLDHVRGLIAQYDRAYKEYTESPDQTMDSLYYGTLRQVVKGLQIRVLSKDRVKQVNLGKGVRVRVQSR